ncbi:unnamed protein product (macronuclear) [Paramecium tetraurelia]|uniref:Uncharacterized protein n=1 Tax=Paramecium tetraurelia TaxID=5888 RepID=A0BL18_PARTE|nr:uncharacterized protein GSPATT00029866001 [Paramecium tetraurelia]CAK59235.1 unnamed protein product [Paramecium tetraurelia]|eukprot:XP_001426633.1 hypothetical protein (macronuclear) [Paramecium tetraurelia strain d4-2]
MKLILFLALIILICNCQQTDGESNLFVSTEQIKFKNIGLGLMRNIEGITDTFDEIPLGENDILLQNDLNERL